MQSSGDSQRPQCSYFCSAWITSIFVTSWNLFSSISVLFFPSEKYRKFKKKHNKKSWRHQSINQPANFLSVNSVVSHGELNSQHKIPFGKHGVSPKHCTLSKANGSELQGPELQQYLRIYFFSNETWLGPGSVLSLWQMVFFQPSRTLLHVSFLALMHKVSLCATLIPNSHHFVQISFLLIMSYSPTAAFGSHHKPSACTTFFWISAF